MTLKTFKQQIFVEIHAFVLLLISVIKLLIYFTITQEVLQNFPLNFEICIHSKQITVYFGRPIMFLVFFERSFQQQITW